MAKKTSANQAIRALDAAARSAMSGTQADRSGCFDPPAEPDDDMVTTGDELVLYDSDKGIQIQLQFTGDTMWATQKQMAELFGVTRNNVNIHLRNIFSEGELELDSVCKDSLLTAADGKRYKTRAYNLDAIISVGYRVGSKQGTMFRRWATDKLVQYAIKGFVLDDERLKNPGGNDYFSELRERIRDIRASEANIYKEVREICTLCTDYDPTSQASRNFFMAMQNILLYAVTSMTAPNLILDRADASKSNMGLTSWQGVRGVTKKDVLTSKNYLADGEIKELNRLTSMTLDYFEDQADMRQVVTMDGLETALGDFIRFNKRALLKGYGTSTRKKADKYALTEYEKFDEARRLARQADGQKAITSLVNRDKALKPKRKRSRKQ